jgi:dTDP-4-amino-4,6-dideoxygalactose transaminase
MDEREEEAVQRVLRSGWVTQVPEVARFESDFALAVGAKHACAVSSCTAALHLALRAAGIGPGDHVITASHSFIAAANAIRYCGAIPVFIDIERDTYNIDPNRLEDSLTPATRAILCVHQMGMPCNLPAICEIARRRGLTLIEDAACAVGSSIHWNSAWEPIGRPRGDIACFSFHPRKVITTGEGGMLTTTSAEYDARFRLLRQHAMNVSDRVRHGEQKVIFESYAEVGFNYRMTDMQAAIGCVQTQRLAEFVAKRRALAARYASLLVPIEGLGLPAEPAWARGNWQSYCVRLPSGVDQKRAMQSLLDRGIASRRGVMCTHLEPAYAREPWVCGAGALSESEAAQSQSILLPLYPDMLEAEQLAVVEALTQAVRAKREVAARHA